jgi:hypothetical protein
VFERHPQLATIEGSCGVEGGFTMLLVFEQPPVLDQLLTLAGLCTESVHDH